MWVEGTVEGIYRRHALKLTSWDKANEKVKQIEVDGRPKEDIMTVERAVERFLADCAARGKAPRTLKKYRVVVNGLKEFCERKRIKALKYITVDNLREFREGWKVVKGEETFPISPNTAYKNTEYLKTFFAFCHDSTWIPTNPSKALKKPIVRATPTLPFTDEEWKKIVTAGVTYGTKPERLTAFLLTMRWTGLRIGDVAVLRVDALKDDRIFVRTAKTGVPIYCPIPPEVADAFTRFKPTSSEYFFWNGTASSNSLMAKWHRALAGVFKRSGVKDGHSHRIRDTFSVALLKKGVSLEVVSELLGHANITITKKHYAPWVKERQDLLESAVQKTWETPKLLRIK
jgi:site-specific recombinase XerD